MAWRELLLTALVAITSPAAGIISTESSNPSESDSSFLANVGHVTDDSGREVSGVEIVGTEEWPASTARPHDDNEGVSGIGSSNDTPVVTVLSDGTRFSDDCHVLNPTDLCEAPTTPGPPGTPAITIRDLATFRPQPTATRMEPDGWAVIDLPANFFSDASTHAASGTLLGRPADVRFTPAHYSWEFTDGTAIDSASSGATWAELGQREFTATPTSRTFTTPGNVDLTPWVTYTAEYRIAGGPWTPVSGTLEIPGPPRTIQVGRIDTVLTAGDCTDAPTSPGC